MDSRSEWLQQRQLGIGGSDAPVIHGVSPWKTPYELWLEKTTPVVDDPSNPDQLRGKHLEPIADTVYREKTGRSTIEVFTPFAHGEYPYMRGNVDRLTCGENDHGDGVLEIKCPRSQTFSKIRREGLPDYILVQLQHYLAVTGLSWGSVAIFCADAWDMIHFDVEADASLRDILIEKEAEFWHHVETRTPPPVDTKPAVDLPPVGGELVRIETDEWRKAVEDLRLAKEIADEAAALEAAAKEQIQKLMDAAEADVAEGPGLRVYWKTSAGRKTFDRKALAKAHPEIDLSAFEKVGAPLRAFRPYFIN
jgi:putative phage-type endonuclease